MDYIVSGLLYFQALFGLQSTPEDMGAWKIVQNWNIEKGELDFIAEIPTKELSCEKGKSLRFPRMLYNAQKVRFGKFTKQINGLNSPKYVFSQITIPCEDIISSQASLVTWQIQGYSKYFTYFKTLPEVVDLKFHFDISNFIYLASTLSLFAMSLIFFVAFSNKENWRSTASVCLASLFLAVYFFWNLSGYTGVTWQLETVHKIADIFLFLGFFSLMHAFYLKKVISPLLIKTLAVSATVGLLLIVLGKNGDEIQVGTTIPFGVVLVCLLSMTYKTGKTFFNEKKLYNLLEFSFSLMFSFLTVYEMLIFSGSVNQFSLFPIGLMFGLVIFSMSVNQKIQKTYNERDQLLSEMEFRVKSRTEELSQALKQKDHAQAELIQNAKLASLGTLSAGIAHEINNSINYVNGAILPLEKILTKAELDEKQKDLMMKLLKSIKDGSKMTVDIVRSLRNYTGLNQAKYSDVNLFDAAENVLTILKNKVSGKALVKNEINPEIKIFGSKVGINQIIMNLISNAVDAFNQNGIITLTASDQEHYVILSIKDNGPGIPQDLQERVFDPFFTTKDVGQGTGLGLHIVKKEVENHKGKIELKSDPQSGTEFQVFFPKRQNHPTEIERAA